MIESLLVWATACVAVVALLGRSRAVGSVLLAAVVLGGTLAGNLLWARSRDAKERSAAGLHASLPPEVVGRGYVSSNACGACHPKEYATWHASYHRTMTQAAIGASVRAPFSGETLTDEEGRSYRLTRRGRELWVEIAGAGQTRITMMTGSHHMEAFWLPSGRGNEQLEFPFTYVFDDHRWVPRRDVFLVGSEYSKKPSVWNRVCVECHVTGGQPEVDPKSGVPGSRVAELGIACEACHGPAGRHVAVNESPFRRVALYEKSAADPTIVNPALLSPKRQAEVCGQCHGIGCAPDKWLEDGLGYRPGEPLAESKQILELDNLKENACRGQIDADASFVPSRYWKDGMVRVSGREYNGLVESPCYRHGSLTCLSCHSMHAGDAEWQLRSAPDSNSACVKCHPKEGQNITAHTHHPAGSAGSECYNCHMPNTTYGLLRAMRSHQVSSPRIADTLATGRPNACNLCHLDRTLAWTADALARWYGETSPALSEEQRTVAASVLDVARGDAGVRAITAWNLGWSATMKASGSAWRAPYLIELLGDEYAAVRYNAYRSLKRIPGFAELEFDYIGTPAARYRAQEEAWQRAAPLHLHFDRDAFERLTLERAEDDEMFLAE